MLRRWALLLPHPPLSLLYLLAMRHGRVYPRFAPLLVLTAFPVAAFAGAVLRLVTGRKSERAVSIAIVCTALIELAWATLALWIVFIALGIRSR
jgi:hypothetical protein